MEQSLEIWRKELIRFVAKNFGPRSLAEDIAQEAITRYLYYCAKGQEILHPRGWLFRTARNLAVDHVRKRLPFSLGVEFVQQCPDPLSLKKDVPKVTLGSKEIDQDLVLEHLPEAVGQLPNHYRRALVARYTDGLGCAELGKQEGLKISAAKLRTLRARRCLKKILEKHWEEADD